MIDQRYVQLVAALKASDLVAFDTGLRLPWEAVEGAGSDELNRIPGR